MSEFIERAERALVLYKYYKPGNRFKVKVDRTLEVIGEPIEVILGDKELLTATAQLLFADEMVDQLL